MTQKKKKIQPSFRDGLWRLLENLLTLIPPSLRVNHCWENILSASLPLILGGNWKHQKLHLGPQTPMPQLIEVAFWVFNNRDQAEEEERIQCENRQARAHAKLIAIAVSHALQPQDNPRGPRSFNHLSRGETSKGECFKCKPTSHWFR